MIIRPRRLTCWLLVVFGSLGLSVAAWAAPSAEFRFTDYRAGEVDQQPGHYLTLEIELPAGLSLADRQQVFYDLLMFWVQVREGALVANPEAVAAALGLEVEGSEAQALAEDLLRFNGPELAHQLIVYFESLADQNVLHLPDTITIPYRQFIPHDGIAQRSQEESAAVALQLPPSVVNMKRQATQATAGELPEDAQSGPAAAADAMEEPARERAGFNAARPERALQMNARNLIASLLSFRSEEGRLPASLDELVAADHLLVSLRSPVQLDAEARSQRQGSLAFERTAPHLGVVIVVQTDGLVRRLQIETPAIREGVMSSGLLGQHQGTPEEQRTRRYVFQIAKLLELFYNEHGYLPSTVGQLELRGFARVGFQNALEPHRPARSVGSFKGGTPGDYYYVKLSQTQFLLVGFGTEGRSIITINQHLAAR